MNAGGRLKQFLILVVVMLIPSAGLKPAEDSKPGPFAQSFLMTVSEDGKEVPNLFEKWDLFGNFTPGASECELRVASFSEVPEIFGGGKRTTVDVWSHSAREISEFRPGVYRVEMNGRLNPASGLQLIIGFDGEGTRVISLIGTMRAGRKGEAGLTFSINRKTAMRNLAPIRNPSLNLPEK